MLRLGWWRFLMDLRPVVWFLAERFPRSAGPAVRLRMLLHLLVGNLIQVGASVYGLAIWNYSGFWWGFTAWATAAVAIESVFQVVRARGGHGVLLRLAGWREAWRVRRRWPADWAIVAAKTTKVQAEVGTSKEPMASARLRPVADHPKMSWWPRVSWPVVSWWVGPPPGRSFDALDQVVSQLAANISHCVDVAIEFNRESDSYGHLIVTFADPLAETLTPALPSIDLENAWLTPTPTPTPSDVPERPPTLRVVGDEWEEF